MGSWNSLRSWFVELKRNARIFMQQADNLKEEMILLNMLVRAQTSFLGCMNFLLHTGLSLEDWSIFSFCFFRTYVFTKRHLRWFLFSSLNITGFSYMFKYLFREKREIRQTFYFVLENKTKKNSSLNGQRKTTAEKKKKLFVTFATIQCFY